VLLCNKASVARHCNTDTTKTFPLSISVSISPKNGHGMKCFVTLEDSTAFSLAVRTKTFPNNLLFRVAASFAKANFCNFIFGEYLCLNGARKVPGILALSCRDICAIEKVRSIILYCTILYSVHNATGCAAYPWLTFYVNIKTLICKDTGLWLDSSIKAFQL